MGAEQRLGRRRGRITAVAGVLCGAMLGVPWAEPALAAFAGPAPTAVGTIPLPPGSQLFGLALSEKQNKIYVTDDNSGLLTILDATTHAVIGTVDVGSYATELVVSERRNKLFVASNTDPITTGVDPGTGLISVIDTVTNQLITTINLWAPDPPMTPNSGIQLLGDDAHDRVYAAFRNPFESGIAYIDTVTNAATLVPGAPDGPPNIWFPTFNAATQQLLIANIRDNRIEVYNGATGQVSFVDLDPTGTAQPLDITTNEAGTKWYLHMNAPNSRTLILDRVAGTHKLVGDGDALPLAFNPRTNTLFQGVQIGVTGGVVDGTTDVHTPIPFTGCGSTCGFGTVAIRERTDNAWFASSDATYVVNGRTRTFTSFPAPGQPQGGLVINSIAINQRTGRVYVINYDQVPIISVFQDPAGAAADFDGDDDSDVAVYRPANGQWFVNGGNPGFLTWGASGDVPVPADYDGNGKDDVAVYRPAGGQWFIRGGNPGFVGWGAPDDVPVPADYDGNGKDDVAVFRPASGQWFLNGVSPGFVPWGANGDVPVPADYDGDGKDEVAVFRPASGQWFIRGGDPGFVTWGASGDVPVPADYDGDGKDDVAVYRPTTGQWFVRGGNPGFLTWGASGDVPVPGDFTNDGKAEVAVYRPGTGQWFIRGGSPGFVNWGASGDVPLVLPFAIRRALP